MVVVAGSEVKEARNPKELFALFDQGTQNRHTASTSTSHSVTSRAHLQPRRHLVIVTFCLRDDVMLLLSEMNDESSRSHLVIGIIIETTNRTSGTVLRGKVSVYGNVTI